MKKIISVILIFLLLIPSSIDAKEKQINMYLFYGKTCPHCKELDKYLDKYLDNKDNINLYTYEVWNNKENNVHFNNITKLLNADNTAVPFLVIGDSSFVGFLKSLTPDQIENTVNYYENIIYKDKVGEYLGLVEKQEINDIEDLRSNISNIPSNIFNLINKDKMLLSTIIIGLIDGFNFSSMWILLFLISMIIGIKDKNKKYILGIIFILISGIIRFFFLISKLNLLPFLNLIPVIRIVISLISIILGFIFIIQFLNNINNLKNKENKIINIVKENSFLLFIILVIILSISMNIFGLFSSLGLPVLFKEILSIINTNNFVKIIYSLIYVTFYLLDDVLFLVLFIKILELKGIKNKINKYQLILSAFIIITIGIFIAYIPKLLML